MTTSTTNPAIAGARGGPTLAAGSFWRASYVVFRRQLRMNLRNPAWVLIGIMQPVLYLFLFGPLLEPIVGQFPDSPDNAFTFLVPGLLVQLGMFGAFFAGFGLIAEWREGVVEAERVTPASRTALLVGRLMRDLLQLFVQALILVGLGLAMGMRLDADGIALGILLTLMVGGACAAASNALALTTKSEDVMAPVINMVMMPVLLLSGIMLPMSLGPGVARAAQRLHAVQVDHRCRAGLLRRRVRRQQPLLGHRLGHRAVRPVALVGHLHLPQGELVASRRVTGRASDVRRPDYPDLRWSPPRRAARLSRSRSRASASSRAASAGSGAEPPYADGSHQGRPRRGFG